MVFDFEMLAAILGEGRMEHRSVFKHSGYETNAFAIARAQDREEDSFDSVIKHLEASEFWSMQPVTKQSSFKTTVGRLARSIRGTCQTDFLGCNMRIECTRISAFNDRALSEGNHDEELLFRFLHSLQKPFNIVNGLRTVIQRKQKIYPSTSSEGPRIPEFEEDSTFTCNHAYPRAELSLRVILSSNILQSIGASVPMSLLGSVGRRPVSTTEKDLYLPKLLHCFLRQRNKLGRLKAFWGSGPQGVLRRCHLHETILLRGFENRIAILDMTTKREYLSSWDIQSEGLHEFEQADKLLRNISKRFRGFLPLSVDLSEGLRHISREETRRLMSPIVPFQKLLDQHNDYDIPDRDQSCTLNEYVTKTGARHVDNQSYVIPIDKEYINIQVEGNGDNTSQESILNDILMSDEDDPEPEPEPTMVGAQEELMLYHLKQTETREKVMKSKTNALETRKGDVESQKVRLRVPDNLMCSSWCLRLARHCVATMPRGTLILPPCLSVLPSLCIIINTHLSSPLQDQRVAIICESKSDISRGLSSYLDHCFACKTSVEVIRRWNFPYEPRYPPISGCTAQILILDSFDFSLPSGVSLLLVLVCEPRIFRSRHEAGFKHRLYAVNPEWPLLTSILIAPFDCWIPFPAYIDTAERLSVELRMKTVMFVSDYDDVHFSVLLAKPRAMFLVPLKEASQLISVIDSHSSPALAKLRKFFSEARPGCWNNVGDQSLTELSISFLKSILEDRRLKRNSETYRNLETVYYLRQARSYALYDGFDVAMAFLSQCSEEMQPDTSQPLQKVMKEAEAIDVQVSNSSKDHPIVSPVVAHMKRMQVAFEKEPPSLSSIHRRVVFLPLIVADSREAVDGFRRGRSSAKLLFEADERDIAICWLSDLISISSGHGKRDQQKRVLDKLKEFTHIYHIMDGRENVHSESKFPPCVMQLVHAGRTRLITVVVDEQRDIESTWTSSHKMYDTMRKHIGDQSRFSGFGGVHTLREMGWEVVNHIMRSLW
eukprot:TRINITY_DN386_c0_g2_i1.p1 TRINITY_DN386_c0_g2~~TRINITY_DN386_c0_g2_i1.p1  ORF type:complete len:999 (+),score=98.51 TRINITY_DN386_c0_g2_i1:54-3050(+)